MPATSEARIRANQINAQKSTGPKTRDGKERSRRNGLKHGMTGRGVVLIEEDAPEVERRSHALMTELDPKSALGVILVGQLATLSVRMERGARQEEAALTVRVAHAAEEFDRGRLDRADDVFRAMGADGDSRPAWRELRRSPEGVDRLLAAWADLRAELTRSDHVGWVLDSMKRTARLLGMRLEDAEATRWGALAKAAHGGFSRLGPEDGADLEYQARRKWANDRLVERVDEEVARLEAFRESLDLEAIERDREGAADVALFDPSPEATRARRYESEARRGFFLALKELRRAEAEAEVRAEVEAVEEAMPEVPSLGSSWESPSPVARGPHPSRAEVAPGLVRPTSTGENLARGLDGRVVAVGRATIGAG